MILACAIPCQAVLRGWFAIWFAISLHAPSRAGRLEEGWLQAAAEEGRRQGEGVVTERQLAAIERARHGPVEVVEIRRERKRNLSFTRQERERLTLTRGWRLTVRQRVSLIVGQVSRIAA
jgi:hypothetical protein